MTNVDKPTSNLDRKIWSAPVLRRLAASEAETGGSFKGDGVEVLS